VSLTKTYQPPNKLSTTKDTQEHQEKHDEMIFEVKTTLEKHNRERIENFRTTKK
jgi:hypothetical protein